jgi:hypothetical protein
MLLHKPGHSTVAPLTALTSSLHDLVNLNFPVFCGVFLKLRKFCKPHNNFYEENDNFIWPRRQFFAQGLATLVKVPCHFYMTTVKVTLLQRHYTKMHLQKNTAFNTLTKRSVSL